LLAVRLQRFRPRTNWKLVVAFCLCFAALFAQDPTSYLTPDVARVGDRLACRCGGCRNTVGNCPMLHCHSADPKRQRIHEMQSKGMSDDAIVSTFVREEGVVALSSPPSASLGGLITWIMPGLMLLVGFYIYMRYVRGSQQAPAPISAEDQALLDRYRSQLGDDEVEK
jgi:cytochrome c-type biogenesis protein CcmH/NrfF